MSRSRQRIVVAAAAAASLSAAASAEPKARSTGATNHDGIYMVNVVTEQGVCDRVYRWTIIVTQGRVASPADGFMQASGKIDAAGVVSLAFRRDNQLANVSGRVKGKVASGRWSSPTLQCTGSWTALRQG